MEVEERREVPTTSMSENEQENIFWLLAKKYSIIQAPSEGSPSKSNAGEDQFKVMKHATDSALTIMEDICALREKTRKLEHEKNIQYHSSRSRFFKKMFDSSIGVVEKINTELELILRKKHMILHLLQNASKKKDFLPIPVHQHGTFLNLLEGLLELCNIKVNIANCFNKLPYIKWEESLQQMQPLKQQTLRNISILNRRLYDVCELENSIDEMLLPTTPFVTSFRDGLELSSQP